MAANRGPTANPPTSGEPREGTPRIFFSKLNPAGEALLETGRDAGDLEYWERWEAVEGDA